MILSVTPELDPPLASLLFGLFGGFSLDFLLLLLARLLGFLFLDQAFAMLLFAFRTLKALKLCVEG